MPGFQHSCFISYKHPPVHDKLNVNKHIWIQFVRAFQASLENFLVLGIPTYRDEDLRSQPGVEYPPELARSLCSSVCMIAILVPEYMESNWCRAEWEGMVELEEKRNTDAARGHSIIPIFFRGDPQRTQEFCGPRLLMDFRNVINPRRQLENNNTYLQTLDRIAQQVAMLANSVSPTDCRDFVDGFVRRIGTDVVAPRLDDPNPLV
jgi:hypothetical protein